MASPSPIPRPEGLVLKKGSKIRSRSSGRMPRPVSLMAMWIICDAGSKRVLAISVPFPSMASAALTRMFMNTCCIWAGSTTAGGRSGWRLRMRRMLWNIAWCSSRARHSWRMPLTLAGRTCGGRGRAKSSSPWMISRLRSAWAAIFCRAGRSGSSGGTLSSSMCA